jgi:hypothetical protein
MKNKSKDRRYENAVERNLYNAERDKIGQNICKYIGMDYFIAKHKLGIKRGDDIYDTRVKELIKEV